MAAKTLVGFQHGRKVGEAEEGRLVVAIRRGMDVRYVRVAADGIRFCGTPEVYQSLVDRPSFAPVSPTVSLKS